MSENIKHVSDTTFEKEVLQSSTPVLVDYWAEWCGPCKMIAPVLQDVAKQYAGRLTVAKLNIDANPRYHQPVRHPRHSDADPVQGRQGARAEGRGAVEIAAYRFC